VTGPGQHACGVLGMAHLPRMGCAGERDLVVGQAEPVGGTRLDERQRLDRLHRRAREDGRVDVAERQHDGAVRVDDRDRAAMARFDDVAAHRLDKNGVGHVLSG